MSGICRLAGGRTSVRAAGGQAPLEQGGGRHRGAAQSIACRCPRDSHGSGLHHLSHARLGSRFQTSGSRRCANIPSRVCKWSLRRPPAGEESPSTTRRRPPPSLAPSSAWSTPFVGREREMEELRRILVDSPCRLLTVIGPGGVGKSRLAFHAAQSLSGSFPDGVYVVPLGAVWSPPFIPLAVGSALEFAFSGTRDPTDELARFVDGRCLLLLLDDFDRLTEGAALLSRILARSQGPRIMVTSRNRLNLSEETLLPLSGLSVPGDARALDARSYGAVRLFLELARRLGAPGCTTDADLPDVVRICQLLEGHPPWHRTGGGVGQSTRMR